MDIKYLLCEPVSKFAIKASQAVFVDPNISFSSNEASSPQSIYSSFSSSSQSSSGSIYEYSPPCRRRTLSDNGKNHVFVYNSRRVRSESTGSATRTQWTPYEDELLRRGYNQGLSWAMISSTYLPHRSRGCCWGRFKTLQNKNFTAHTRCFKRPWKSVQFDHNRR